MKTYLFAYGSMKKEFQNHYRLIDEKLIGKAITKQKYNMYPAPSYNYPYGVENEPNHQLKGELYELTTPDIIKVIDDFEGAPYYYYRKLIEVIQNNQTYEVFIYFKSDTNPNNMEDDLPINEWTKEFEKAGKKLSEFMEQLRVAIQSR